MTEYAFHELATVFPLLEGGEYTALIDDIRRHGLLEPITLFEGKILDGRNRYRACLAAGVEPRFREILFGDYAEAAACVISANIHRRHLTAEQRRELIEKLLKADPGQSDRQIAETAKVSDKTVAAVRRQAEARAEIPHVEKRTDRNGRSQPARKEKSSKVSKAQPRLAVVKRLIDYLVKLPPLPSDD
jgi:ParB-like chromosome segregation protein Spo0J